METITCQIDGRKCSTPICIEDPENPPCVDAVISIAAATVALGTLGDRVNIDANDKDITHPDLMSPIALAVQTLSDRLGFDMEAFMNHVDDTLKPGEKFILTVDG